MTGRGLRRLLIVALVAGVGYWIYKDQPTVSGLVDAITSPLFGSHAAVKSSERNRLTGDATAAISEQSDVAVGTLREGMTTAQVRELLGDPEKIEEEKSTDKNKNKWSPRLRWIYGKIGRALIIEDGRVVSIVVRSPAAAAAP
jgi:hypothetical protein